MIHAQKIVLFKVLMLDILEQLNLSSYENHFKNNNFSNSF